MKQLTHSYKVYHILQRIFFQSHNHRLVQDHNLRSKSYLRDTRCIYHHSHISYSLQHCIFCIQRGRCTTRQDKRVRNALHRFNDNSLRIRLHSCLLTFCKLHQIGSECCMSGIYLDRLFLCNCPWCIHLPYLQSIRLCTQCILIHRLRRCYSAQIARCMACKSKS